MMPRTYELSNLSFLSLEVALLHRLLTAGLKLNLFMVAFHSLSGQQTLDEESTLYFLLVWQRQQRCIDDFLDVAMI